MGIVVGEINLGKTKKIICSIENYRGNDYASIRIWINSPTFIGPTTSGLILDKDKTKILIDILNRIKKEDIEKNTKEKLIDEISLNKYRTIKISLKRYKGKPKLDIREYIASETFKGYTKKGLAIHPSYFLEFVTLIKKLGEKIGSQRQQILFFERENKKQLIVDAERQQSDSKKIKTEKQNNYFKNFTVNRQSRDMVNKSITNESVFTRLFHYYWAIHKTKANFSDLININKTIDYFDLSAYLKKEFLFTGNKEELIFNLPLIKSDKNEIKNTEDKVKELTFEKVKKLFLAFQENIYERELIYGFPFIFFKKSEEELIAAPLFIAPCKLEYETLNNEIRLRLLKDDFELNIALLDEFLNEDGKNYVRDELFKIKPYLPLDQKSYENFIISFISLLNLKIDRKKFPKTFELNTTNYRDCFEEKNENLIINKTFLVLTRKSSFYILNDLEKLIKLADQAKNSILSKFFDPEDVDIREQEQEKKENIIYQKYLFPYPTNNEQIQIVDSLSKHLILVEGPPGTGKSHSISNIICHLVANGNTVLVTSQKNKALDVIEQNYLKKTQVNYLNMTLLKNDSETKKELIEKISDLNYYINQRNERETKKLINEAQEKYTKIEYEIAELTNLFEETKESMVKNEKLFKEYNSIKEFNLIKDDVLFLKSNNYRKFKNSILRLIKIYKIILPEKEKIDNFIRNNRLNQNDIIFLEKLLNKLVKIKKEKRKILQKKGINLINKINKDLSLNNLNFLFLKSNDLIFLAKKCDRLINNISDRTKKLIFSLLDETTINELKDLEKKSNLILENIKIFKQHLFYADSINSDDPAIIDELLTIVKNSKKEGVIGKLLKLKAKIALNKYKKLISNKIFNQFPKTQSIDELEDSCICKKAEINIKKLIRNFYLNKEINDFLQNKKVYDYSSLVNLIINSKNLLINLKKAGTLLNYYFKIKLNQDSLSKVIELFNNLTNFACALREFYSFQVLTSKEIDLLRKIKLFIKEKVFLIYLNETNNNSGIEKTEELLKLCHLAKLTFRANKLIHKDLLKFEETIKLLKRLINSKNPLLDFFEKNIDKVFNCEILENKIKEIEKKYPLSTDEILKKINNLKKEKIKTIKSIIQYSVDLNLIKNYKYSTITQREIAHFKKQIRRSKKNYKTFEELKKEFDFRTLIKVFPCWIMSIEDVARIFPLESGLFDYVIIDEASQCSLPSSIPILFRGKRAIIVGDDHQLSDFTKEWIPKTLNESLIKNLRLETINKFDSLDAKINSLFDSCSVFRDVSILLREHFRSYPEIINFSNAKFYNNKLIIMTHSLNNNLGSILNIVEVANAVENELKINEKEAEFLVKYLKKIIKDNKYENLSFGILSLFREQANFIRKLVYEDDLLRSRIQKNAIIVDTVDGFQGDERDVVFYSFRFAQNSSPNIFAFTRGEEGWRRVNVAFTRAKKQIFCFISQPVEKFPEGLIKDYLKYTKHREVIKEAEGLLESDFEKDVYNSLKLDKNLIIIPQFKTCGFYIDFVLRKNGKTLALECDGIQHYTKTGNLIEKDIERQDILERAGWVIKRISSREFYRDQKKTINNILCYFNS